MNDSTLPEPPYGRHRFCPHCGVRVALRATTCFACGASLDDGPPRRMAVPWADFILFAVIGGLIVLWWTHPPATASGRPQPAASPTTVPSPDLAWLAGGPTGESLSTPVAPTLTPTPPPALPTVLATPLQHKVKPGESVGLIADQYGVTVKDLTAVNGLSAGAFIYPGQMLKIPGTSMPVLPAPTAPPTPTATPTGGTLIYTVKSGDTFFGLAAEFHTDVELILKANNKKIGDFLGIGDHILIPLSGNTPEPTATVTGTPVLPTFTPQAGFRAPALLMPPDNSTQVRGAGVLLTWTAVGLLADDEWYLIVLRSADSGKPLSVHWTKGTSWRLDASDRVPGDEPAAYAWEIQVVQGSPDQPGNRPAPLGPASPPRSFTW